MAQNTLPHPPDALLVPAGECEAGLMTHGATLGITQITGTDHFPWFKKKQGETAFTLVTDTAATELLADGQASATTVEFCLTAVNPAGESVPSATISVAVK
jgi:hypothetical protein